MAMKLNTTGGAKSVYPSRPSTAPKAHQHTPKTLEEQARVLYPSAPRGPAESGGKP